MALTREQSLIGFSKMIGDYFTGTTTSAGASDGTTLVDTALAELGADYLVGAWARVLAAGSNQYISRRITSNSGSIVTFAEAFPAQVATAGLYEVHRYDPEDKLRALTQGRILAFPQLALIVWDETLVGDGSNRRFTMPSTFDRGVDEVLGEDWSYYTRGNALRDPLLDALSTNWTAASLTAQAVAREDWHGVAPKGSGGVRLTGTVGTYSQVPTAWGSTAADLAGMDVAAGVWVYSQSSARWTSYITTTTGTTSSAAHGGTGWEWLSTGVVAVPAANATFTFGVDLAAGTSVTAILGPAVLRVGADEPVLPEYREQITVIRTRSTGTRYFETRSAPVGGQSLRVVGRKFLTDPAPAAATQIEVDEGQAQFYYAKCARALYASLGLGQGDVDQRVMTAIQLAEAQWEELRLDHEVEQNTLSRWEV